MSFASPDRPKSRVTTRAARAAFFRPQMEALEKRDLLALWVVNSLADTVDADADVTSLREAVLGANGSSGPDTITFNVAGNINI